MKKLVVLVIQKKKFLSFVWVIQTKLKNSWKMVPVTDIYINFKS